MLKRLYSFHRFALLLLLIINISWVIAAPVYKSTDAEGNVTYSSEPPPEAEKVQEVAVPKSPPSDAGSDESSIDEIKQKADALGRENAVREKEIQQQKVKQQQQQKPVKIVVEEPPVYTHRPVIENKPKPKPPISGGGMASPKPVPLPSRN